MTAAALAEACRECPGSVPATLSPGGPGWAAAMACTLEASAPKPGNVHPAAEFPDLSHAELLLAAAAAGEALDTAATRPLGEVILEAVVRSRRVTRSNANLGMILAIAPLAAVPDEAWTGGLEKILSQVCAVVDAHLAGLTRHDAAAIWQAISEARPGGMGTSGQHDLAGPPPDDIRTAMQQAAGHDGIARLWVGGYDALGAGLVADLGCALSSGRPWREAIVDAFLRQLARTPDSLIARRHGAAVAAAVSARAAAVVAAVPADRPEAIAAFDRSLRAPVRVNPGTTADLVATALYILLRSTIR